jgi:hypothetical protein
MAALEPDVYLVGVAGGGGTNGLAWWSVDHRSSTHRCPEHRLRPPYR